MLLCMFALQILVHVHVVLFLVYLVIFDCVLLNACDTLFLGAP